MTERYLEDFKAGQNFRSGRIHIDADQLKSFTAGFDPQPFHRIIKMSTTTLNQNNEPVQVSLGNLIMFCRPASSGETHG